MSFCLRASSNPETTPNSPNKQTLVEIRHPAGKRDFGAQFCGDLPLHLPAGFRANFYLLDRLCAVSNLDVICLMFFGRTWPNKFAVDGSLES